MQVTVPAGKRGGEMMCVDTPAGQVEVVIPLGLQPEQSFHFSLPPFLSALEPLDESELFTTAHLTLDRVKQGDHLTPGGMIEKCMRDKRTMFAWKSVIGSQMDKVRSRALSKGLTASNFRHMFLRPDDTDLEGMRPHVDPLHEERFELMAGRLRRKFMEKGVLFGKTNERVGRGGHERKRTAEQVVDLKNIDAPSDDDGVDDNNRQLQIVQEGDQDHHVLHRVHRQQRPPEVQVKLMSIREKAPNKGRTEEPEAICKKANILRGEFSQQYMELESLRQSNAVAPNGRSGPDDDSVIGASQRESEATMPRRVLTTACVPSEAKRVLNSCLQWHDTTERYIPGCGRKRCETQMGFAHRVLPEVPTDRIARPQSSSPWWSVCFADKEPGLQKADQTQGSNGGSAIQRGSASGNPHCRDQESKTASFSSGTPMGHMALVDVLRLGALSQRPHTVPGQAGQRSAALGRDTHYESSHIVFPISTVPPPASAPVSHTEAHSTLNGTVAPGANPFRQPYARTLVHRSSHCSSAYCPDASTIKHRRQHQHEEYAEKRTTAATHQRPPKAALCLTDRLKRMHTLQAMRGSDPLRLAPS